MTSDELQSKTIRWLRFPLAIAVVFAHDFARGEVYAHLSTIDWLNLSISDTYNIIRELLSDIIARGARPCFFIFSGFLFFNNIGKWSKQTYFDKIKRRFFTLIIPYILWNIIPILVKGFFLLKQFDGSLTIWLNELWENGILKIFWNYHDWTGVSKNIFGILIPYYYPCNYPLWFIRDLIILAFLAPLIFYFIKYTKFAGVIALGICFITQIWLTIPGFSIDAVFFYSIGAYFSINGKNMIKELQTGWIIWLIIAVIAMFFSLFLTGSKVFFFRTIFVAFGSITFINIVSLLLERGRISADSAAVSFLSKTSFFIFAAHSVCLLSWAILLVNTVIQSNNTFLLIVKYLLAPFVCVIFCITVFYIMKKITPKLLNLITGSRL